MSKSTKLTITVCVWMLFAVIVERANPAKACFLLLLPMFVWIANAEIRRIEKEEVK